MGGYASVCSLHKTSSKEIKIRMKNIRACIVVVFCILNIRLHAGFSELPAELKSIIATSLISSYSSNEVVPCVKSIQSLARMNRQMWVLINTRQTTAKIIGELAKKFEISTVQAAVLLATPGAVAWLKHVITINKDEKDMAGILLVSLAGQDESRESLINIKTLLKAGVDVNSFQERRLGVLNGVVEKVTPLIAAQKKGNREVEKLLLRHPQIDLGFKTTVFKP